MMRTILVLIVASAAISTAFAQQADTKDAKKSDLSAYLIDIDAGAVSAGGLVGLEQTAVQQIETSQDLIVAIKPFTSGDSKSGFGLAITPARTSFLAMPAQSYLESAWMRALGALTFSYAENSATIASASYRKTGVSADAFYFVDKGADPIWIAHDSFSSCNDRSQGAQSDALAALGKAILARKAAEASGVQANIDKAKAAEEKAKRAYDDIVQKCLDEGTAAANKQGKSSWNASRIALSLGAGWIKPEAGGSRESLGKAVTLSGILRSSANSATYLSLRHTSDEADLSTLGTSSVAFKSSNLAAARFAYGREQDQGDMKVLAEVSNASSKATQSNSVFKYALGLDKKIDKGTWLQFRAGRNRTLDGTQEQTTALMTLNFAPTSALFGK